MKSRQELSASYKGIISQKSENEELYHRSKVCKVEGFSVLKQKIGFVGAAWYFYCLRKYLQRDISTKKFNVYAIVSL